MQSLTIGSKTLLITLPTKPARRTTSGLTYRILFWPNSKPRWPTHYEPTLQPHTPGQTTDKKTARAANEKIIRNFIQRFLHWPPVTDGDRTNMGIPNRDTVHTDHKGVTEMVDYVLHLRNIREIMVDFWIQGETHKAKPAGYDGAVIVWGIRDAPPSHTNDLINHSMASPPLCSAL